MHNINKELERLRGVAVLLVMLCHDPFDDFVPSWFCGHTGVDLFFVVSGFVVVLSLIRKLAAGEGGLRDFYIRRAFRIIPLAMLGALLALVGAAFFNRANVWSSVTTVATEVFEVFTLRYNYMAARESGHDLIHYWSLNVEEHFYLLLPLFLLTVRRFSFRVGFLGVWILLTACVLRSYAGTEWLVSWDFAADKLRNYSSHCRFDGLALGVVLGLCFEKGHWPILSGDASEKFISQMLGWGAIGILVGIGSGYSTIYGISLASAASGMLVFLATFEREFVLPLWKFSRFFEFVGARSYSLYILHHVLWYYFANGLGISRKAIDQLSPGTQTAAIAAYVLCTFGVAELSYRLLERPCMAWGRRLTQPQPAPILT